MEETRLEIKMKHGDFTELADNYAKYRPGYSPFALDAFLALAAAQSGGGGASLR